MGRPNINVNVNGTAGKAGTFNNLMEVSESIKEVKKKLDGVPKTDEEDITSVDGFLKLADKEYKPEDCSGLGRVYLRKNLIEVYPDDAWFVKRGKDLDDHEDAIAYLLYSWHGRLYDVYNSSDEAGLVMLHNLVKKNNTTYDHNAFGDLVEGTLTFTEDGGIYTITLPNGNTITNTELDSTDIPKLDEVEKETKNILTQSMFQKKIDDYTWQNLDNTIFIVQYDYDLIGEPIEIPEGCTIMVEGGSIKQGELVCNNTTFVVNRAKNDVLTEVTLSGTYKFAGANPDEETITVDDYGNLKIKDEGVTANNLNRNIVDDEDIHFNNDNKLQLKDKEYNIDNFSGLGRKYLRKNIVNGVNALTQEMINDANTIYVIQYDYDLNDPNGEHPITIPENCVLKFEGGSLRNGNIVCQHTTFDGNVAIDRISGSINGEFISSYSKHVCDYNKLKMLLSLSVDNLVLDENYSLNNYDGVIQSSLKKVVGENITISVGCDIVNNNVLNLLLSFGNYPTEISGIKFDFNGHAVRHAIVIQNTAETFYLGDISILNIDNRLENVLTNDLYYCNCINIAPSNNSVVNIANVVVDNMKIWGVGDIGDASGSQYGIFCTCGTNVVEVNVKSCSFDNIEDYTYDDNSRIIHDSAGLYVSKNVNVFETSYNIEGIEGTAFGKRLIKTDGGNVKISSVTGYQGNVDVYPLSLISLNAGNSNNSNNKTVYVSNITYTGDSDYVVGLLGSGDLNNICVFSKSSTHAIIAAGDKGITVNNVYINGFRPLIYSTNNNLSCTFNNVTYEYNKDDVPEAETITHFNIATGYGLQLFINNLNLFGGGYGYILFTASHSFVGQRSIQINGLYYEAYLKGSGVNLATLIEVGSDDYGLNLEINNANIKITGNNYRRVFNCPKNSSLTIKNTEINVEALEILTSSIPYGTFILGDSNKLHLNNTKVSYRADWSIGVYSLYIYDNRTNNSVFNGNSIFICNCNVNEVKPKVDSKTGISFGETATKVAWSGGDVISVDRLPVGLGINNEGFKTKLSSWNGYYSDKTITWDGFKYVYNISKIGSSRPNADNVYVGFQFFDTSIGKPIFVSAIDGDVVTWIDEKGVIAGTPTSGTFANKPTVAANNIPVGFKYFCTDKQTVEGATDGIEIIHKGNDVWVDALGRVV